MTIEELFSDIEKFHRAYLELAVYVSSFLFLLASLSLFFHDFKIVAIITIVILFVLGALNDIEKSKKNKKITRFVWKTIAVFGSIFVLALFVNYYLKISFSLNQFFLNIRKEIETSINKLVINMVAIFAFLLIYSYICSKFSSFVISRIKSEKVKRAFGTLGIFLFSLLIVIFFGAGTVGGSASWGDFVYSKLSWLLGFSLIFLHLNYLIREGNNFLSKI